MAESQAPTVADTITIVREFDAPRALVFKAWTDPSHLVRWWGPRGFTTPSCAIDARPGGAYRIAMRGPNGSQHRLQGVYRDVVAPERLVCTYAWVDDQGEPGPETIVTVLFEDLGGRTRMTFRQEGFRTATSRDAHDDGWSSSFDMLEEELGPVPIHTVTTMRAVDGAAPDTYQAWADPARLGALLAPELGPGVTFEPAFRVLVPGRRAVLDLATRDASGFVEARFFAAEPGRTEITLTRAWRGAAPADADLARAVAGLDRALDRFKRQGGNP